MNRNWILIGHFINIWDAIDRPTNLQNRQNEEWKRLVGRIL